MSVFAAIALAGSMALAQPTDAQWAQAFGDYDAAISRGDKAAGADVLVGMLANEDLAEFHGEVLVNLGDVLRSMDLHYGGLLAYGKALELGERAPSGTVEKALEAADNVGDPALLEPVFGADVGLSATAEARSRMAWLAAKENYRQGNFGVALGILALVDSKNVRFVDAQHLKGIVLCQQGRYESALAPLLTAEAKADEEGLLHVIRLNLGRAYYGAGNFPRAIEYYAKVPRSSPLWLQAQFERAWAHFRLEDVSGALGILHTQVSPFFEEEYHPEAWLLRTYSLFLLCKFPEASVQIQAFRDRYGPVRDALESVLKQADDGQLVGQVRALAEGGETLVPAELIVQYLDEPRMQSSLSAVDRADDELARLQNVVTHAFSSTISSWVHTRRQSLILAEGARLRGHLDRELERMSGMINDTDITRMDIIRLERRLYEQASAGGKMADARAIAKRSTHVPRGWVHWPYEGEYWADELGYYRAVLEPECPADLRPGG